MASKVPRTFVLDDLDPERPKVAYKGEEYPAALPDDFGLDVEAKLKRLLNELEVWESRDNSSAKAKKIAAMAGDIVHIYFPTMPLDLIAKIPDMKKMELIQFWGQEAYPPAMRRLTNLALLRGQAALGNPI